LTRKVTDAFGSITITNKQTSGYAMWFTVAPKPLKIQVFGVTQPPGVAQPLYSRDTIRAGHVTYMY